MDEDTPHFLPANAGRLRHSISLQTGQKVPFMKSRYIDTVQAGQKSMKSGQLPAAIANFREAIQLDSTEPLAFVGLAEALTDQGDLNDGVKAAREAVMRRPNFGLAQFTLARCLCRLGVETDEPSSMEEAFTYYKTAQSINASTASIPQLDSWRETRDMEQKVIDRQNRHDDRVTRWAESRAEYGLSDIPYGEFTDEQKAVIEEEKKSEKGKRWWFAYNHRKR